jgi:hypothetical protein
MEIKIEKGFYQEKFLNSEAKFPALISAIATGKTMLLLLKIVTYCETYPGSTALIVRREFSDLRDSTMLDFKKYFGLRIIEKNCQMANGSLIMFRHAAEMEVLKNVNLSIVGIEQSEEFDDDTQFHFLRDRLRQKNGASVHPLCVIANSNGQNWVWKLWVNKATTVNEIDKATGQYEYISDSYHCLTANSFANEKNLVPDFVADLRQMEFDTPNHYQRFVLNSFEQTIDDDTVFKFSELLECKNLKIEAQPFYERVVGFDVARYGSDKSAAVGLERITSLCWRVFHVEEWEHKDLNYTTGRIVNIASSLNSTNNIIDEDGMGAGPLDFIKNGRMKDDFVGFRNSAIPFEKNPNFVNPRTAAAFKAKEYIAKGWIIIDNEKLIQELMTLKYKFTTDGRRILISKEEMRKQGVVSPNLADSFLMSVSLIENSKEDDRLKFVCQPRYSKEENLFKIYGIK